MKFDEEQKHKALTKAEVLAEDFDPKEADEYTTPRKPNNFFQSLILKRVKLNNKKRGYRYE